jgi:hypothetical protein
MTVTGQQFIETVREYDCARGYFMSQDEQDATIGRVVRERKELKAKIATLKAKANQQGETLANIARVLGSTPELVAFMNQSSGAAPLTNVHYFDAAKYPQLNDIAAVGNEIRETMETLRRVEAQATQLGV